MSNDADSGAPREAAAQTSLARNSLTVGTGTVISRITGFLRVAVIGAVLGPTYLGNTYQSINLLPNITFGVLTGSLFVSLLVPPLVRHVDRGERSAVERLAGGFLGIAVPVFAAVTLVLILAGPLLLWLFSAGVAEPATSAGQRRVGGILILLIMPQVVLYGVAATGEAVMNAHGRFALGALAPTVENLGIIATLLAWAALFGTGDDITGVSAAQVQFLGAGTTAAVALHAAVTWWGARRVGVRLRPRRGWRDAEVRAIVRRAVPSLGYTGLNSARTFAALVVANAVPGGVVAFEMARNFYNLPVAIGARPVAMAGLPPLSRLFNAGNLVAFRDEFVRVLSLGLFLTIPAAVAYVVLADPLARAIALGEMSTPFGITLVAVSIGALGLGVLGDSGFILATNASYARGDASSPFWAMVARAALTGLLMVAAFTLASGPMLLLILGLAFTVGDLAGAAVLLQRVFGHLPRGTARVWPAIGRGLSASAAMVLPAWAIATLLPQHLPGRWRDQVAILLAAAGGLAVFLGAQRLLGSPELAALRHGLGSLKLQPRTGAP